MLVVLPRLLDGVDETLAHRLADDDVVERDVVRRFPLEDETVVVDRLDTFRFSSAFNRCACRRVERIDEDDLCSLREALIALVLLSLIATLGVQDERRNARSRKCLREVRLVKQLITSRRRRV